MLSLPSAHGKIDLPMAAWSAGQREFTPLILGLYRLLPASAKDKDDHVKTVIIEEPEMGLHPRAITSFMFTVMELMYRGYSVVLSTHSPAILEVVWALKEMGKSAKGFLRLFDAKKNAELEKMAVNIFAKKVKVFYFSPKGGGTLVTDISGMDPGGMGDEADWGGLTEQSSRISEIVAEANTDYSA